LAAYINLHYGCFGSGSEVDQSCLLNSCLSSSYSFMKEKVGFLLVVLINQLNSKQQVVALDFVS